MSKTINFYRAENPYGFMSNFSRHRVFYNNDHFPTSEHAFQAMKFVGTDYYFKVKDASTPGDSAKKGRSRAYPLRADWETVKDEIMYDICLAKFKQNKDIGASLLETGDAILVEYTENDYYWGSGGVNGGGRNQLGITLMRVRDTIRNEKENK
ncbi:hypothetical protein CYY_003355 [Polysphondylium violaceum]|uniref:NADAR domain-containing protein n=1 Tax=Polysphondylium violaceum TaxID=133409 RepID=A0A8J4Q6X1_9MYCE|nr:hypothetical protein CYY_003355 [Polysphondylium violaceum]